MLRNSILNGRLKHDHYLYVGRQAHQVDFGTCK